MEVSRQRVPVVRPPLVGSGWLTANGLAVENHHRNDVIALNGRSALPQRFAVDWVQVDAKGSTRRPGADPARNESYYCYGAPMLAVAPGRVTEVVDRFKDNFPVGTMPTKFKAMLEAGGNYIALDLGHGLYGFYCHLQPGSAKVKVGDRVRPGQVLGLVGNSGASTERHLHFHMVNGPHLVADEGVPYVFDTFYLQVSQDELPEESKGDELPVVHFDLNAPGRVRHKEMPLMNTITRFAE